MPEYIEKHLRGNFGQCLGYLLFVHGTRPNGSTSRFGMPWTLEEFAKTLRTSKTAVEYWLQSRTIPIGRHLERIEQALFGNNKKYDLWKDDLRLAYNEGLMIGLTSSHRDVHTPVSKSAEKSAAKSKPNTSARGTDEKVNAEYRVWFGTNRLPNDPRDLRKGFSANRDGVVHHGTCTVYVPKSHKIGSIGSPWWQRWLNRGDDRLRLLNIAGMTSESYRDAIAGALAKEATGDRQALVFVHGYNVSFEDAALRTAQIGFDLSIKHAMAFFSWPSRGRLDEYQPDEAAIDVSEEAITEFMTDFVERSGADRVHVIAHSMGNRGVLRAVNRITTKASLRTGRYFGQIILAAADVDTDLFKTLCGACVELAQRTTLYISARDLAVEASRWLHDFPRAGLMPPVLVMPGIDTINVTKIDLSVLGHGYVGASREVLQDMHALITSDISPELRFGLRSVSTERGERYWEISA